MKINYFILFFLFCVDVSAQYRATDWKERDKWQKTSQIFENLQLEPGMSVADVGCHEGYLTMKLSTLVEAEGTVYAVDIDKNKLKKLNKRLKDQSISNVQTVHGDADDPKLPVGQLDRVILLDTYHEIEDYQMVLRQIHRALKPTGKLVIIEPIADERRTWSRKKQADKHEISISFVIADLYKLGFKIEKKMDPFIDRPTKGDKMWLLVASRLR